MWLEIILNIYILPAVTGSNWIPNFASLAGISVSVVTSEVALKIYKITAEIKNYKSIIKIQKMHDKIVLLAKTKLTRIEV